MSDAESKAPDFESVKTRLAEIADAVDDENLPLDDALDLYEEAVALGLKASDLLEVGINLSEGDAQEEPGQDADGADASSNANQKNDANQASNE